MGKLANILLQNANHSVHLVDFETFDSEEVLVSDFTRTGCRVQSQNLRKLDKLVGLRVSGLEKMIRGRVCEIGDEDVGIRFEFNFDPHTEKRTERRRSFAIDARVAGVCGSQFVKCEIIDASLSGCCLSSDALDTVPDDINLSIPRLGQPVRGRIVWRGEGVAGVQLLWQFSGKTDVYVAI